MACDLHADWIALLPGCTAATRSGQCARGLVVEDEALMQHARTSRVAKLYGRVIPRRHLLPSTRFVAAAVVNPGPPDGAEVIAGFRAARPSPLLTVTGSAAALRVEAVAPRRR
jgi:hypothetical protein